MRLRATSIIALALWLVGISVLVTTAGQPPVLLPLIANGDQPGWKLVFHDEFDRPALDEGRWMTRYWHGRTNPPELQYYAPDAFELSRGVLRIKAEPRRVEAMEYTSGLISTEESFDFTYGIAEIRARVPRGQGLWPAFWLITHGTIRRPEIDILEILGHETNRVHMTRHYLDSKGRHQNDGQSYVGPDFSEDFHVFTVEWSAEIIRWYVDGVEVFQLNDHIPAEPMYLIANLAVGGNWPGPPDESTPFPAYFEIDYIRVYQR